MLIYVLLSVCEENSKARTNLINQSPTPLSPASSLSTRVSVFGDQTPVKTFRVENSTLQQQFFAGIESSRSEAERSAVRLKYGILESGDDEVVTDAAVDDRYNHLPKSAVQKPVGQDSTTSPLVVKLSERITEHSEETEIKCVLPDASSSLALPVCDPTCQTVELRNYQLNLAACGTEGRNCIICAPTGTGKTFTAGYICRQRGRKARNEGTQFKALFIVCMRNLVHQQRDALKQVMSDEFTVTGFDDGVILSEYLKVYDVVVATAQVNYIFNSSILV